MVAKTYGRRKICLHTTSLCLIQRLSGFVLNRIASKMNCRSSSKSGVKRKLKEESNSKPKKVKQEKIIENEDEINKDEWLADIENIDLNVSCNLIQLFEEENTIPFIARYRQHLTNGMDAEKLRQVKETYDEMTQIRSKADALLKSIAKEGPVDSSLGARIKCAKSLEEIELLAAPFKKGSKSTLASRAKKAGLEEYGLEILHGNKVVEISQLVQPNIPGCEDEQKIMTGLKHIVADAIAKDPAVLELLETLKLREVITLECSLRKGEEKSAQNKYDLYKNFSQNIKYVKDHQVLAINRAEAQKVLSVKVNIPVSFWDRVKTNCKERWLTKGAAYSIRTILFESALDDAIQRLLSPLVTRQVRSSLTTAAERSSISVFTANLKRLLLSPPLRGKVVMAIDPGVTNGCKVAVVSPHGQPLYMDKVYLASESSRWNGGQKLVQWAKLYDCETIALGNGTFCRETEKLLASLIQNGSFRPLDVAFTIVDEQGVSIYSCSPTALAEFPGVDPNFISAISLGRRLQDPLAELVKVEPKHLGVGMYQHDTPEKKLNASLEEVVSECVSFVGVDLNTASVHLLRRVAGLTRARAEAIVAWRLENGPFQNRQQLLKVKSIGEKTFQQCAGFVRILPATAALQVANTSKSKKTGLNPLDQTEIHPEDYTFATKVIKSFGLSVNSVGTIEFIQSTMEALAAASIDDLAKSHSVSTLQMRQLTDALKRPPDHDLRSLSQAPLFRRGITTMESIKPGDRLTGVVRNVVQFGAFVDVGVGQSGLIHSSQLGHDRSRWVQLGDKVEVIVMSVELPKKLSLRLAH